MIDADNRKRAQQLKRQKERERMKKVEAPKEN